VPYGTRFCFNKLIFGVDLDDMAHSKLRREALVYHAKPQPGKIKIVPTKPYATQRDLALA
jgi:malic enzyme